MRTLLGAAIAAASLLFVGCGGSGAAPSCDPLGYPSLATVDLVAGVTFDAPVFLAQAPGDDATFYVVQKGGLIVRVRDGAVLPDPFLDLAGTVTNDGEMGLLGLAFHPDYPSNGRFFVYYVREPGGRYDVVAEYARSSGDPELADPTEVRRLVGVYDRATNHNGGMLAFEDSPHDRPFPRPSWSRRNASSAK